MPAQNLEQTSDRIAATILECQFCRHREEVGFLFRNPIRGEVKGNNSKVRIICSYPLGATADLHVPEADNREILRCQDYNE